MKKLFISILAVVFCGGIYAQAVETRINFNKNKVSCVSISLGNCDANIVKDAMKERMEQTAGLKGSNFKGWRAYQSQAFSALGDMNFDIYTKVVTSGKNKNRQTVVYMLLSKGNENFISSATNPEIIENTKTFLSEFSQYVREYGTRLKIATQEESLDKLNREYYSMSSDVKKMQKQINNLQKKVSAKEDDMAKKQAEIEKATENLKTSREQLGK